MQTIRCKHCGKFFFEAEGNATIIKDCPKCRHRNKIKIESINTDKCIIKIISKA